MKKACRKDCQHPSLRHGSAFAYSRRGEVASATVAGQSAAYAYDFIGNFTSVTEDGVTTAYGANALNQYETVDKPGATLEPTYTPNGELAAFGPWTYAYDALSRLTEVRSNGVLVASNSYDHQGRRVRLVTQTAAHTFIYDGWNVVLELVEHDGVTDRIEYYWGKDISGSLQGAGGVGGLLYLKRNGAIYVPIYDAYGNVMEYRSSDGLLAAAYVYDAFGRTISQTCPLADAFRFRYSTKSFDAATGLYYYGKRFYFPELRRWLSRDPIAEDGGGNLCAFCENKPVFLFDMIGLSCKLGTYNVLRLDTWQKSLSNGLASNPDFMDHGNDLLSSIGTLGDLMSLSSLSPSSLANFQSFVDAVAGKGMSPNADVMARLRDLYERLKHGPLRIYGILEYEVCVCKGNKTEFEKQENITDDEDVLNSSDLFEVQNARRKIVKYMINEMYSRIRKQR